MLYVDWCIARAKRAIRAGDLDTAERWHKLADKVQQIEQRGQRMRREEKRPVHPRFVGN